MEPRFELSDKLQAFAGEKTWYYLRVSNKLYNQIKSLDEQPKRGFGAIKVKAQINDTIWKTSIFPTKEKIYLLFIKASVRKAEKLIEGKSVRVIITLI